MYSVHWRDPKIGFLVKGESGCCGRMAGKRKKAIIAA
jgi:hypothetical protein